MKLVAIALLRLVAVALIVTAVSSSIRASRSHLSRVQTCTPRSFEICALGDEGRSESEEDQGQSSERVNDH
ncbi:hypothetical protein ACYX8G_01545 [Microbacterium saperdae]